MLAQQVLSANLNAHINDGSDEVLIFINGSERSLRNLMELIKTYEQSSGQLLISAKSGFFISDKFQRRVFVISRVIGMNRYHVTYS